MRHIVYTRHEGGGVSICTPTDEIIKWLSCGGYWNKFPRGYADIQIERMVGNGIRPDAARRFANAITLGGCTTAEAFEIIRDRDCAHLGTGIELWDTAELPDNRWFRDAWHRSANGGPITIDLRKARPIQFRKIVSAVEAENKKRAADLDRFDKAIELDMDAIRQRIRGANDETELRSIWPKIEAI